MDEQIIEISGCFCGPDGMGNGGYVSGLVAEAISGPAKVRLHAPTPLDTDIQLVRDASGARLMDGEKMLVEGEPLGKPLDLDPMPTPPSDALIEACRARFPSPSEHMAPRCFVCGPERDHADALHICGGFDPEQARAADRWVPATDLAGEDGLVATRYLWAALDCPSYFGAGIGTAMALLAGMAARIVRHPHPGEQLSVTGWPIHSEGRKHHSGSVMHDADGNVIAAARALWVKVQA
ncbi:MAG: hypothetical protein HKO13_00030 [Sphingomonas sp.]|nr:hypothetical protein [Sphingomonas sp.]